MIKQFNLEDDFIVDRLFDIQIAAYSVEANIVQFNDLPPLRESKQMLMASKESFYGYFKDGTLVGVISFAQKEEHEKFVISRLIVDPLFFRMSIASSLLTFLKEKIGFATPLIESVAILVLVSKGTYISKSSSRTLLIS